MSTREANILDPIHDALDDRVWDDPASPEPRLKPEHRQWILSHVLDTLRGAGYHGMEDWLSLVLTGSLTTYQYSESSDCDISLFVDVDHFPDWDRAAMIGVMVEKMDGTTLPGTPFPMQCFVVPPQIKKENLYQPGLRSGYDLDADSWIVPPDKSRVHDVSKEMNSAYVYALESADKMERLLEYEPEKATMFWHQIHKRRRRDQMAGKGDYSDSNIVYKMLANRGLFPKISDISGEYIASKNSARGSKGAIPLAKMADNEFGMLPGLAPEWQVKVEPIKEGPPTLNLDALTKPKKGPQVRKFVFDPVSGHVIVGQLGAREGEQLSHYQLGQQLGLDTKQMRFIDRPPVCGLVTASGDVVYLTGKLQDQPAALEAVKRAAPDVVGVEKADPDWEWESHRQGSDLAQAASEPQKAP